MTPVWPTYLFLIGFMFMIEFGVARVYSQPYNLRRALVHSGAVVIGLTLYYLILAW